MNGLDITQIKEYLPHRYPLLLVDRVLSWESKKTITALKNVTVNEEFFNGHFPNKPVMPGVLTIEALAQTAALLAFLTMGKKPDSNTLVYFLGIDKARFRRIVEPGDQLILKATVLRIARGVWKYEATASVGDDIAVEAEFMCTMRDSSTDAASAAGTPAILEAACDASAKADISTVSAS